MKYILSLFLALALCFAVFAQAETLSNNDVISMTKAGLSRDLIARKIKDSRGIYDTTAQALIELKKAGVADEVIALMMDSNNKISSGATINAEPIQGFSDSQPNAPQSNATAHIVLGAKEALASAKTIAIEKSSLNPSRQALEKELLKRKEWQQLNLNIVRHKESADLYIEIGFVPLSIITHRYVFRVYDSKSGTVIAAGETTSWGSLAKNLAREISKKLGKVFSDGK